MDNESGLQRSAATSEGFEGVPKISATRIVAGTFLIGIFLAGADFVTQNYILPGQWDVVLQRYNGDDSLVGGTIISELALMVFANLAIGFAIITTYASILPRFGAGSVTAAKAALLIFLPASVMLAGFAGWLLPWRMFFGQAIILLLTFVGAGCLGAWVYSKDVK